MVVTVFVHEIDVTIHPQIPPGFRWAVHLGVNPHDMNSCLNAGWCPTEMEANVEGEMVGVTVVKALTMTGPRPDYRLTRLNSDPITAELMGV